MNDKPLTYEEIDELILDKLQKFKKTNYLVVSGIYKYRLLALFNDSLKMLRRSKDKPEPITDLKGCMIMGLKVVDMEEDQVHFIGIGK